MLINSFNNVEQKQLKNIWAEWLNELKTAEKNKHKCDVKAKWNSTLDELTWAIAYLQARFKKVSWKLNVAK